MSIEDKIKHILITYENGTQLFNNIGHILREHKHLFTVDSPHGARIIVQIYNSDHMYIHTTIDRVLNHTDKTAVTIFIENIKITFKGYYESITVEIGDLMWSYDHKRFDFPFYKYLATTQIKSARK